MTATNGQVEVLVNGEPLRVPAGSSVADVVARFAPGLEPGRGTAVALADEVVPTGSWGSTAVTAGDRLEVLQAVAGG
ncbi:sulfur carrier protein ThiS [Paenibacillus sp. TRM 82003]|uniref:sulfur carrier protein ThiS n=1 Tax=Kineococcus sp. TRM81007 TaxID=2925831 RepID=UPI001F5605D0|nr:sulfur carrier protein ThiS [Kineococcus sp. TRM81007]MCI2237574.1 sulfur carrier protein ThiS [Kineococcus sp. TRM81007]MCI3921854.1 sulfur carrier protein ThiS [Paenibacillus sp. TRM 82003]